MKLIVRVKYISRPTKYANLQESTENREKGDVSKVGIRRDSGGSIVLITYGFLSGSERFGQIDTKSHGTVNRYFYLVI